MTTENKPAATIQKPVVTIYTDGACKGNPGRGGWGAWLSSGGHDKEMFGGEANTTNNRMELTAVIEALASLKRSCKITIYTDSEYVRKGMTEWISGWQRRGWRPPTANRSRTSSFGNAWTRCASCMRWSGAGSRAMPVTRAMSAPMRWPTGGRPASECRPVVCGVRPADVIDVSAAVFQCRNAAAPTATTCVRRYSARSEKNA